VRGHAYKAAEGPIHVGLGHPVGSAGPFGSHRDEDSRTDTLVPEQYALARSAHLKDAGLHHILPAQHKKVPQTLAVTQLLCFQSLSRSAITQFAPMWSNSADLRIPIST
jgi:hypothetical protein